MSDLHKWEQIQGGYYIDTVRRLTVPGGWLYVNEAHNSEDETEYAPAVVTFVPYPAVEVTP